MRAELSALADAVGLSHAALRGIRQNPFFAFVYTAIGISLAAGVQYPVTGWLLLPIVSSAAVALSSVSVVTHSLWSRGFSPTVLSPVLRIPTMHETTPTPSLETFAINGMSCGHCVASVQKALEGIDGVAVRSVEIGHAEVETSNSTPRNALVEAIENAGFTVQG